MSVWISENWLALYAATVGTIALIINLSRFIHTMGKDKVKFRITAEPHPNKSENEAELAKPNSRDPGGGQEPFLPVYRINVSNIGNVDAYIESAYVLTKDGAQKHVLITDPNDSCMYGSIGQVGTISLQPKTTVKLIIYLKRGEPTFDSKLAEILDGTGKKWNAKI